MRLRLHIILTALLFNALLTSAQDKSNRGKEFWLGYGFHWIMANPDGIVALNSQEMALYISAEQAATVTVSITGTSWSQTLNIPANTVDASITIPKSGPDDARILTDGLSNRAIHIVSDVPVAVYAHVYVTQGSGATMLMPAETYGYSYYSINYSQKTSASPLPAIVPTTQNGPDWYSWFYVVASEDNTQLQITPSDTTKNGWLPGQTYTVNLNKGQIYSVFGKMIAGNSQAWAASKDMTGSKVVSVPGPDGNCHPFALFSGSSGIRICRGDGGEYMQQQMFPSQAWGTRYLTYHTINNTNTDILETNRNYYRICVSDPTAVVKRNGVTLTGLINNFYYEIMDSTGGDYIQSDKPILVAQYTVNENQCWNYPTSSPSPPSNGDPEMFYISPIEQGQKAVRFYASRQSPAVAYVYANIHVPTVAIASLRVDGNPVPASQVVVHPNNPAYSVALTRFIGPAAQHTITCDSAFTSTVYGLGNYESYGYNVGTLINNLNYYSQIKNVANTSGIIDTFTCPKTPVRLFVKVGYVANAIHWKLSQVSGIFPNTDSIISNPVPVATELINGRTYYIYSLQQDFTFSTTGTYYIPVTYSAAVIQNCSQSENAAVKVVVKPSPVADFTSTSPACLADSVRFTGTANPAGFTLANYLWSFDDLTTANTVNTVKKFNTPGVQNVRYRVYASNGCVGDTTKQITIYDTPKAKFGVSGNICQKDSVRVTDTSSITIGSITSWKWDFGDGTIITAPNNNPQYHHYSSPGPKTISLIVTSDNGCKSDTFFRTITVFATPTAKFGYSGNICAGDSILFSDSSKIALGNIVSWHWSFGDGQSSIRNNNTPFYHTYSTAGTDTVKLVVISDNGCTSDTFRLPVFVNSLPSATITSTGSVCVDSLQRFVSSFATGNPAATWYWDFGDGQTFNSGSSNIATHAYSNTLSNITVKHVISLGVGCTSDTARLTIPVIHPNPVASFSVTIDTACVGKPVAINSLISGINTWSWNFGDGTGTTTPPFSHSYSAAGNYNIILTVSSNGCKSAPDTVNIDIYPNPAIDAGPDKFIAPGASVQLDASNTTAGSYAYTWSPAAGLNAANMLNPIASPDINTEYTLMAVDNIHQCVSTDKVIVRIITKVAVPNAFTPNNDGLNDTWRIPGLQPYPESLVSVFNRFGVKVYEARDNYNNPWDGNYKGTQQPNGTYVYIIYVNDAKQQVLKGTVTLFR